MLDALKTVLGKMHQDALPPESVDVFCYSKNLRGVMRNLVYQLLAECIDLRLKPMEQEKRRRFKALRMGDQMYGLFFERRGVSVQKLENSVDFYRSISTNKLKGSPLLMLDRDQDYPLPAVVDSFASEVWCSSSLKIPRKVSTSMCLMRPTALKSITSLMAKKTK